VSGSVTVTSISYDLAGGATATIETYPPNASGTSVTMPSKALTVSASNNTETGLIKTYPLTPNAAPVASIAADKLFPFQTKYAFFTGSCANSNPSTYDSVAPVGSYWGATPTPPGQLQILPAQQTLAVTVRQPPLLVNLKNRSNGSLIAPADQAKIRVVAIPQVYGANTCVSPPIADLKVNTWTTGAPTPAGSNPNGWVGRGMATAGGNSVPEAGVPFGRYKLCFEDDSAAPQKLTYPSAATSFYDSFKPFPGVANAVVVSGSSGWVPGTC
jgi:hypothetical protein